MSIGTESLARLLDDLRLKVQVQEDKQKQELDRLKCELRDLRVLADRVDQRASTNLFVRRAEWTLSEFSAKRLSTAKGGSLWSPQFRAAGVEGLQLEFFPNGREKTTHEGFCSLFLWSPKGWRIKYQLFVGSFRQAPDLDEYADNIGHGHSNFCPVDPEIDLANDQITIGVVLLEVTELPAPTTAPLRLTSRSLEAMAMREMDVMNNRGINKVVWKVTQISKRVQQLPRGASLWSPMFTASGIREVWLEFYPNGSVQTTKDGYCAFYVRCTPPVSVVITLIVGKCKKGPIKTSFEGPSSGGKGLPEFCLLGDQVNTEDDSVQVGIELQKEQTEVLTLES